MTKHVEGIVENAQKKTEEDRKRTEEAQKITEKESKISQFRNGINETYRLIDNKDFDDAKKKLSDLEKLDFHKKVREGFLELAKKYPERFYIVDASQPFLDVCLEVYDLIKYKLKVNNK